MKPECYVCPLGRASLPSDCPFDERHLQPGTVLVRQGEVPSTVWFLKSGAVLLSALASSGHETYCALRSTGDLVGTEGMVDRQSPYESWAFGHVVACRLPIAQFRDWLGVDLTPTAAVLGIFVEEMRRLHEDRALLVGDAVSRVARYLLARLRDANARTARLDGQAAMPPAPSTPDEPLGKGLLARLLGIRAETLSRALHQLRELGAIRDDREISVADPHLLERLAGEQAE